MDDWIKMARHYAARDAAFIVGGTSLLLCFDFCFPYVGYAVFGSNTSGPEYLLLAGVAYVLGYFAQEVLSLLFPDYVTTSTKISPGRFWSWTYKRYTRTEPSWAEIPDYDEDEATIYINEKTEERNQAEYERMTAHLIMCITIGSCWVIAGVMLMVRCFFVCNKQVALFGFVTFALGSGLVFLGRLKALHIRKFTFDLIKGEKVRGASLRKAQSLSSEQ